MRLFFIVLHLIITLLLIGVILLQKQDESGQATGIKVRGTGNLLSQITIGLMLAFFSNSLWIAYMAKKSRVAKENILIDQSQAQQREKSANVAESQQAEEVDLSQEESKALLVGE